MIDCECKSWTYKDDSLGEDDHHPYCPEVHESDCECVYCMAKRDELNDQDEVITIEYVKRDDK